MSILRTTNAPAPCAAHAYSRAPLRVLASGTLFLTHTLLVPAYPESGGAARAQSVQRTRGGHSANVLAILAQFRSARPPAHVPPHPAFPVAPAAAVAAARSVGAVQFCGPLAGNDEGARVVSELEAVGVATTFSVVRDGKGVPAAWVIESGEGTKTVINHNPLPDMTHDEFVARLGPVLAPENYAPSSPPLPPVSAPYLPTHVSPPSAPCPQCSGPGMPPFDWMHFEGRAPQTTLANITGLDGLARERGWRSRCVFSLGVTRAGVESLIQHADVVFFSKPYAHTIAPAESPRAFLISMSAHAAPHALLVADWGTQGAALLSVPTREYLQSSGWVEPAGAAWDAAAGARALASVRTGSGFWADGRPRSGVTLTGSDASQWTAAAVPTPEAPATPTHSHTHADAPGAGAKGPEGEPARAPSDGDADSQRTSLETERGGGDAHVVDAGGAHEAFVAGMVFALSQRILPGRPYVRAPHHAAPPPPQQQQQQQQHAPAPAPNAPNAPHPGFGAAAGGGADVLPGGSAGGAGAGKWRLEECLRFATELAGRKGRRRGFEDLRGEMDRAGWVVE